MKGRERGTDADGNIRRADLGFTATIAPGYEKT
ncbi:MAG: hypothetical protein RIQ60_2683 [Pseudomonadota bacterium]|jgi:hypothetical protein